MVNSPDTQQIPVKMYTSGDRLVVAAPMPGLEQEDAQASITEDGRLMLYGRLRGELKGIKDVLMDEWAVGDYARELSLPMPVDGSAATMTYGNGVIVVSLPVSSTTVASELRVTGPTFHADAQSEMASDGLV